MLYRGESAPIANLETRSSLSQVFVDQKAEGQIVACREYQMIEGSDSPKNDWRRLHHARGCGISAVPQFPSFSTISVDSSHRLRANTGYSSAAQHAESDRPSATLEPLAWRFLIAELAIGSGSVCAIVYAAI
jgi:hypothetical protein